MRISLCIILIGIFIAIANPSITVEGAAYGLKTWWYGLVPTLLPFMIASNFLLDREVSAKLLSIVPRKIRNKNQLLYILFNIITGFTFGLPVGAKVTSTLVKEGHITKKTGQLLLNDCNTIGPAFVGGFFLNTCLHKESYLYATLLILYGPPLLHLLVKLPRCSESITLQTDKKIEASRSRNCFQILDTSIKNGFETIMVLGGYLLLFGISCAYATHIPYIKHSYIAYLLGTLEITSGIKEITLLPVSSDLKYLSSLPLLSFGGLCTLMQTKSVTKGCPLSLKNYLFHKLTLSSFTAIMLSILLIILY